MLLAIFLSLLQVTAPPDSSSLTSESKSQADYYINRIINEQHVAENIWALTLLGSENDNVRSYIKQKKLTSYPLKLFNKFDSDFTAQIKKAVFQTGSPDLLVSLLLSIEDQTERKEIYQEFLSSFKLPKAQDINYEKLCSAIVQNKKITEKVFPNNKFFTPHFFLLFDNNYSSYLSKQYLEQITSNWTSNYPSNKDLKTTLAQLSYFRTLYITNKYAKTATLFRSISKNKLFPNSSLKLRIYRYLDYSMYSLGYYDRSLNTVRNFTLPLAEYLNQKRLKLGIKLSQGVYLYSIGKIKAAEKIYQDILKEANEKEINIPRSSLYNNLALTYHKLGKYDKYLDLQFQALNVAKKEENYEHQLEIFNNLFIYYKRNNDQQNAIEYLEQAKKLAQEKGNNKDLGKIYISLGTSFRQFNQDYQIAFDYFNKAKKVLDPQNDSENYIFLLIEQANTFEKQKKYSKALDKYEQIIKLTPENNNPNHLDALVNKALVYLRMGKTKKAGNLIKTYKSYDLNKLDFQQIIKAKTVEAEFLNKIGKPEKAIGLLEPALEQIVVRAKNSADLKSGFWHVEDEYLDAFELAVSIYRKNSQYKEAIETLDQLKTINDASLYQNPLVKSSLLNESELTQYKQLTNQLDAIRKKLLTAPESQHFDIRQTISQLKLKKRKLDRKLTKNIDSNPISIQEVQNRLSARELVMHITELKDQYYIAQISRSDISIDTIPLDSKLRNLLSSSVQQVAMHQTNLDSLYKITRILGLKNIPDRIEQVTIIPDSYFYQLPIDILPLEKPTHSYSYGQPTYVIETFRTQYLTSLEEFDDDTDITEKSKPKRLSYAGYGVSNFDGYQKKSLVPLPFAKTEVLNIADKLTHFSDIRTFINDESTKPIFTNTAPQANIIHLATHSEVSERDPMFSTIYLSKAGKASDSAFDDQVFAYELFELDLSNEMIMLNSCESGSGSYIQGTGVMGISRALRYAGARSLILNLWSVNDMLASDFAIHFYDQLNQGKSKAEALRNTKQYFLRTKNASPHFWGPYILIGDTDPIVEPNQDKNLAMAGVFVFYFMLMIGLSYLAQRGIIFTRNRKDEAS